MSTLIANTLQARTAGAAVTTTKGLNVGGASTVAGTLDVTGAVTSGAITADGTVTATSFSGDGSSLTGLQAGKFLTDGIGITTVTPVGIETTSVARKDLAGPAGNTATGAGSSFHGAYLGDGFLSFNTEFSNSSGYYISTFTNSLVAGPIQLGSTLTLDGNLVIV